MDDPVFLQLKLNQLMLGKLKVYLIEKIGAKEASEAFKKINEESSAEVDRMNNIN